MNLDEITIDLRVILLAIVNFFLVFPIVLVEDYSDFPMIAFISILQLIISIAIIIICKYKAFSLPIMFSISLYVFHFGYIILHTLDLQSYMLIDVLKGNVMSDEIRKSIIFALLSQAFINVGYVITGMNTKVKLEKALDESENIKNLSIIFNIGKILFAISIIPALFVLYLKYMSFSDGNYISTYKANIPGWATILESPFNISIIMMMVGKQKDKHFARSVLLFAFIFYGIYMIIGIRSTPIIYLISLFYVYISLIEKVRFKTIIKYGILFYVGSAFIISITKVRIYSPTFHSLIMTFFEQLGEFPLWSLLGEFGGTIVSLAYSVKFFPDFHDYLLGKTYLISWLSVYPNIGGLLGDIPHQYAFVYFYPDNYREFLGGSCLGELYANFGMIGSVFSVFIGMFVGKINKNLHSGIANKNWLKFSINMIIFPFLILWVRDYFYAFIFQYVWLGLLILLMYNTFKKQLTTKIKITGGIVNE